MKKTARLGIIGYFAVGKSKAGGQEAKTRNLVRALRPYYAPRELRRLDTGNWKKAPLRFFQKVLYVVCSCPQIIILPAQNSVRVLAPLLVLCAKPLKRKLHYVVVGGWLAEMTRQKKWLAFFLKKFDGVYVETAALKNALAAQGFDNLFIMPNFKNLPVLAENELVYTHRAPFAFCTFSRVMKEKGIEEAINAVTQLNAQTGYTVATLDIYGKIGLEYAERFAQLCAKFPPFIRYKGVVSPDESVQLLKNYFALLFPTYYAGEGFAGTLLDALAAGVPVIASDWKYNKEIVADGKTGVLIKTDLLTELKKAVENPDGFNQMKGNCLQEAQKYTPSVAVQVLAERLKGDTL